ncbi:hypothetical protein BDV28DRAFT_60715 [Aspergillus coremiiformis]|uniref:Two-component sensor protein histidine protein kinase n=1 Tax=Aspergillus coremiiformis TaxID=138285 RepID=A0A5N6Z0J0_9EURO|nr:hypothetical protein BDV28DRAFT_60715 [Aspergillus coremiiformis]
MESSHAKDDHNTGRRVRELYRYFQPEQIHINANRTLSSPSSPFPGAVPVQDSTYPAPPSPSISSQPPLPAPLGAASTVIPEEALVLGNPNTTLSSFAQLGALRLDVERVLIRWVNIDSRSAERLILTTPLFSVSDRNSQFILAQSSRSSTSATKYETGDGIWNGCTVISADAWKMCAATVALGPPKRPDGLCKFLVIDDLTQNEEYKDLSLVREKPNFRFYAGTPLTTETNINIGCLFVLDTKPHDGLTDADKEIMKRLSMLIMDYLRVSRQASEGRRATRLSRGLSCFVEGSSSLVDTSHPSYAGSFATVPGTPQSSNMRTNHLSLGSLNSSRRSQSSDARSISSMSESRGDCGLSPLPDWWSGNRRNQRLEEAHGSSWAFKRAANLLRESLELGGDGGVIFLEAGNTPMLDMESGSDCSTENTSPAPVLAISTTDEPFAPGPGCTNLYPASNFDSAFLHQLVRQYTKGKLWSFHRDGLILISDDEKPSRSRSRATKTPEVVKGGGKKWKSLENSMLNLYFPSATQVLFVPLWNAANSQWFAGCFCWNTIETRVLSSSVELSSVLGFGSSIMAEHSRVESLISDRQKGDFIGSISHELRSPLHGILAAAEFLNGTKLDDFQVSLLETIDACGRTLLDTMNQVLDYSKIVSLEKSWRHIQRDRAVSDYRAVDRLSAHLDTYVSTDLALLTEEVVEGVCLGHAYGQKSTVSSGQPVVVSPMETSHTDADKSSLMQTRPEVDVVVNIAPNDWVYQTQPGALRRIIMNVFGNAMKYTDSGRVSVRLEVTEAESRPRRSGIEELVTLVVSDTGKGISEEFLRGRLYTPFAQEDTLAVGTGLGLSIVRSLVKSLNGRIDVNSTPGEGTTVKVTMPLSRPDVEDIAEDPLASRSPFVKENDSPTESRLLRDSHSGRRVGIAGVEPDETASHPCWSVVSGYLTEWYGLELVSWKSRTPVDIVLADGATLSADLKKRFTTRVPALLLLCDKTIDRATKLKECSSLASIVNIIRPPCGPHKLARSIRKCFDSQADTIPTVTSIALPERPKFLSCENGYSEPELSDDVADLTPGTTSSSAASSSLESSHSPILNEPQVILPSTTIMSPSFSVQSAGPPEVKVPEPNLQRLARVLVVDDNSINLKLMLTFMKKRNLATLDSAENGKVAVDAVETLQQGYDLIFMDISMPVMNGFEATRAIRALEKERDCRNPATIIALTGLSSSRDESEALSSGVDLFLTKPVSFKEVSRLLDEWAEKDLQYRCLS